MFEIQKSGDKTSSGEIGLDIRTHASLKVGQDQVSGGVNVLCKVLTKNVHVQYESTSSNGSKVMAKVKLFRYVGQRSRSR